MKSISNEISPSLLRSLGEAVAVIRKGGIVAFPTETSYGLAADPFNEQALQKLYSLKKRDSSKPILILVSGLDQLNDCVSHIPTQYNSLIHDCWPGPLTLIFPVKENAFSPALTAGLSTVAIRWSSHPVASAFVELAGMPLTATSANFSGMRPALSGNECHDLFKEQIDYIVDYEKDCNDSFSTIVGLDGDKLVTIRKGTLDIESDIQRLNAKS